MADKLISQLGATAGVVSTDVFEIEKLAGPPSEKATIAQLITLLNTIYAPTTGGLYVLKSGDTMTGPLLFSPDNTVDIGTEGATRPRIGYFGSYVRAPEIYFNSALTMFAAFLDAATLGFQAGGNNLAGAFRNNTFTEGLWVVKGIGIGSATWNAPNTFILAEAADILGFRRDANAQTLRFYRTWTDASNYERGSLRTAAGQIILAAETAGTGTDNLDVVLTAAGTGLVNASTGIFRLGTAFTVATLPAAGTQGRMAYVTDALTPTFLTLAVGGGAIVSPVFDNGAAWVTV